MNRFRRNALVAASVLAASISVVAAHAATAASPLVTPAWLRAHLNEHNLVVAEVYDTDAQKAEFEKAHVPGAVFIGFLSDGWRQTVNGVPYMLAPEKDIAKVIGRLGIGNDDSVVLIPGGAAKGDIMATTRVYWELRIEGVQNVSILNGGDHAWQADSADPLAHGAASPQEAVFVPRRQSGYLATLAMVKKNLTSHEYQLVDSRSRAQFEGKEKSSVVLKAGTIPGAHSLPFSELVTADHEGIRDHAALLTALHSGDVTLDHPAITFCNTGHLASLDWFVLREVLGNQNVRLFDGSMAEWTRHPSLPVVPGKVSSSSAQH